MHTAIDQLLSKIRPKCNAILRTQAYYSTVELIQQYKTHIWCLVELHSGGYFHAAESLLDKIANVQARFLSKLGVSEQDAFLNYNFAPTELRRNIAVLGVLHKRVLGKCHRSFEPLLPWQSQYPHMVAAVDATLQRARPKCQALMRTRSFYNTADMLLQFKTHILGILESNIGGIYHATSTVLAPLDRVATTFVHGLNLEVDYAFLHFNLAPLSLRRDIAMLGFLHKTNLPHAHPHIKDFFPSRPGTQIWDVMGLRTQAMSHTELYRRSLFHLVHVYNALPRQVVHCSTVSTFQHQLTNIARYKCSQHHDNWQTFLSARHFYGRLLI